MPVTDEALPTFRYYRDPVGDGTIQPSPEVCDACSRARGFLVTSTVHGADVPADVSLCPWCVADGTAHDRFGASYNEVDPGAGAEATAEAETRTPGFATWQDWEWPTHCGDVAVYVGQPTAAQMRANPEALAALRADLAQWEWGRDPQALEDFVDALGTGSPAAYLFECPRCGAQLVRWDED
jgi:uncharacterized protein CbrC (UPF0167 family)